MCREKLSNPGELTNRSMPEIFGRPQSRTMTSVLTAASSEPSNEAPSPKLVFSRSLPLVAKTRASLEYHSSVGTRRRQRTKHADVNGILDWESQLLDCTRLAGPTLLCATGSYPPVLFPLFFSCWSSAPRWCVHDLTAALRPRKDLP